MKTAIRTFCLLLVAAALMTAALPRSAHAQRLTLGDALRRADSGGYANRVAAAESRAQEGRAAGALRGILPSVRVEGGYVRTTDPLGAFGASLRQRTLTAASFDPARLNDPDAIGTVSSALVVEQPLVNADAWLGRSAARRGAEAARATEHWTRSGSAVDVIRAYYGAVLAGEQVAALDSAARAAHAHARQAESLHRNGVAARSDALLAAVRASEADNHLVAAQGAERLAKVQLAVALGAVGDTALVLPDSLPDAEVLSALVATAGDETPADRADVRAARLALSAATADGRRATALLLPRINAFGRLDWNTDATPFGGREAWTAGLMVSWSPFSGGAELAARREASARRLGASAAAEAAEARGRLELADAATALIVAQARMHTGARSVDQSAEAHRIVSRKYEGGLATVVELFDAAAEETRARLEYADARYQVITALAQQRRAAGLDPGILTRLDDEER
ncbi:MAG TPA: TolC family protein [Gemmatimonadales bacterium]|nr:TolC family protein [Gemmatimonadales bacterium]